MESYQGDMQSSYQGQGSNYFQEQTLNISSNIKKISQNVSSMSKMVNQLQTPQDSQELRHQLRQIQHYTQKLAKDTSSMLMALMKVHTDQPAQKLARDRLSDEYMGTLNSFQATQRLAAQKTKDDVRKPRSSQPINIREPKFSAPRTIDMEAEMQQMSQAERSIHDLEQREKDYRQLESDIMDVNQIFTELGTMIHAQGSAVDSIESHVEYTSQAVEGGTAQLREAYTNKNKLRKKKIYIAVILAIVISIIIIILVKT